MHTLYDPQDVFTFWFKTISSEQWFAKDDAFDKLLTDKYGALLDSAAKGELFYWRDDSYGRLAEIIVLDQFSRNIHRDTPQAFAQDPMALVLAQEAYSLGSLNYLTEADERTFLLMPYMHSESAMVHKEAEWLFHEYAPARNYEFELKHKVIIDRFGRYPHRNDILGRTSTAAELEFLQQPGSSF